MIEQEPPELPNLSAPMGLVLDPDQVQQGANALLGMITTFARLIPGSAGTALANTASLLRALVNNDEFRIKVVDLWNQL